MHQLKEVLARLRAGEPERAIARSGAIGRDKLASLRAVVLTQRRSAQVLSQPGKACDVCIHAPQL